jgi:hypothetical protein
MSAAAAGTTASERRSARASISAVSDWISETFAGNPFRLFSKTEVVIAYFAGFYSAQVSYIPIPIGMHLFVLALRFT